MLAGRRSISAKHNSSDSKSFSKSFSNTKKDELMKVINEAKQKLENVRHFAGVTGAAIQTIFSQ